MVLHPAPSTDNASCTTTPWQKKFFLHPAPSIDNASCTTTPWQKKHTEKWSCYCQGVVVQEALSIEGAGCKFSFFCQWVVVQEALSVEGAGCKTIFQIWHFFYIQFKNTSNLIFPGFKVPSKSFFPTDFKTGLTFWYMWFFNFQNSVRNCQHNGGTPCINSVNCSKLKICQQLHWSHPQL